ncbi:hypothetical protein D3C71_1797780 [compost metagenome]
MSRQARLRGQFQHIAKVFQDVFGGKSLVGKLARQHRLAPMVAQHEAVAGTLGYGVQQHFRLHAGAFAQHHHFSQRHGVLEHQRVVDQLDHLAASHLATARHV